ncbi:hypothetical protein [Streptomyces asiaticus]|uniref:hypothetical protein n=1 Tax=Streptomyces asiaticus TaxID=114695 RepID=UPI0037FB00DA
MPTPHYDARTVTAPDGTRLTVAYKPGSPIGTMTDAQFLAEFNPDKMRATITPTPHTETLPDTVTDLAEARLRRHHPGTPYTANEIAPLLDSPDELDQAARIAALINAVTGYTQGDRRF